VSRKVPGERSGDRRRPKIGRISFAVKHVKARINREQR
jgi:hypothetical protein